MRPRSCDHRHNRKRVTDDAFFLLARRPHVPATAGLHGRVHGACRASVPVRCRTRRGVGVAVQALEQILEHVHLLVVDQVELSVEEVEVVEDRIEMYLKLEQDHLLPVALVDVRHDVQQEAVDLLDRRLERVREKIT